jgi:DAK2 domain fusion protein YloV
MPEGRQGPEGALVAARELVGAALAALEASRARIDDLNVYPVPDGDTGTNMTFTVRAVRDALAASHAATRGEVAHELTRSCLMGARGNSGVILSQLVRGAAESLAADGPVDTSVAAVALRAAADGGYAAVREPQEGTILTVARALAEHAESLDADLPLPDALAEVVAHGDVALAATREQLEALRAAGVVDAGGAGLLELVRGITAHVRGEPLPAAPILEASLPVEALHQELSRYRYCTSFYVEGENVDPGRLERELEDFGDSLLVVGAPGAVKIHVHTDDPGRALSLGAAAGVLDEIDIKNMHVQTAQRETRLTAAEGDGSARTAVVAVCAGAGNERLFRSLGAALVVEGGQTMNPATSQLLAAIEAAPAADVILLPNNTNVVLAAEQAAAAASKPALVVPTGSLQAGLAALVAFEPSAPGAANAAAMRDAADAVRTGAVTRASRDATVDGLEVREGQFLGLLDGKAIAAADEVEPAARDVLASLLTGGPDVLTVLVGDEAPDVEGLLAEVSTGNPQLEVDVHQGGQPHYPLLFGAE